MQRSAHINTKNNDIFTQIKVRNLSESAFLANLTPPNMQSFKIKSESKSRDHV